MARRIIDDLRGLPSDVRYALGKARKMTETQTLSSLKNKGLKPVTPLSTIRKMAKSASKKSGFPISVTKNFGSKEDARTEGVAIFKTKAKKINILIHPLLQYRTKKHIRSIIGHELDHARVYRRWKKYKH